MYSETVYIPFPIYNALFKSLCYLKEVLGEICDLFQLGGRRCHDLHEQDCLLPYLGAGPHAGGLGSGYYTVRDYKDILTYAKKRHVEIIPEVDLPGHAHAAIKAMLLRYGNLKHEGKGTEAEQFLLSDLDDQSRYHSVQQFKDNVINVCMESTYAFVEAVMTSLVEAHKDIAPLQTLHIGGDEVPGDALMKSPKCKAFMEQHGFTSQANLTKYFSERILKIASKFKVNIQGWEDVFYQGRQLKKFDGRSNFTANVWSNIWTGPNVHRSYNLANNGYKVCQLCLFISLNSHTFKYFVFPGSQSIAIIVRSINHILEVATKKHCVLY